LRQVLVVLCEVFECFGGEEYTTFISAQFYVLLGQSFGVLEQSQDILITKKNRKLPFSSAGNNTRMFDYSQGAIFCPTP
jgi:hypothetical protein